MHTRTLTHTHLTYIPVWQAVALHFPQVPLEMPHEGQGIPVKVGLPISLVQLFNLSHRGARNCCTSMLLCYLTLKIAFMEVVQVTYQWHEK